VAKLAIIRAFDWLRAAAADASRPGHAARIEAATPLLWRTLRQERGAFQLAAFGHRHGLSADELKDASAAVYRCSCQKAAADDLLTPVEEDQLAWIADRLELTSGDRTAVHDLVDMPPSFDPETGEVRRRPRSLMGKAVDGAAGLGRFAKESAASAAEVAIALSASARGQLVHLREVARAPAVTVDAAIHTPGVDDHCTLEIPRVARPDGYDAGPRTVRLGGEMAEMTQRLINAARSKQAVRIEYQSSHQDEPSPRVIEPAEGLYYRGVVMLQGWQLQPALVSPCWRTFRLDRISKLDQLSQSYRALKKAPLAVPQFRAWAPDEIEDD